MSASARYTAVRGFLDEINQRALAMFGEMLKDKQPSCLHAGESPTAHAASIFLKEVINNALTDFSNKLSALASLDHQPYFTGVNKLQGSAELSGTNDNFLYQEETIACDDMSSFIFRRRPLEKPANSDAGIKSQQALCLGDLDKCTVSRDVGGSLLCDTEDSLLTSNCLTRKGKITHDDGNQLEADKKIGHKEFTCPPRLPNNNELHSLSEIPTVSFQLAREVLDDNSQGNEVNSNTFSSQNTSCIAQCLDKSDESKSSLVGHQVPYSSDLDNATEIHACDIVDNHGGIRSGSEEKEVGLDTNSNKLSPMEELERGLDEEDQEVPVAGEINANHEGNASLYDLNISSGKHFHMGKGKCNYDI